MTRALLVALALGLSALAHAAKKEAAPDAPRWRLA